MLCLRFIGLVQGVGFRPFFYRIAHKHNIYGGILNHQGYGVALIDLAYSWSLVAPLPKLVRFVILEIAYPMRGFGVLANNTGFSQFFSAIFASLPPLARIDSIQIRQATLKEIEQLLKLAPKAMGFAILPSDSWNLNVKTSLAYALPQDSATCKECLEDIFSPTSRHYGYHLTSCTNCGARYSIIKDIPYDREHTAMKPFILCKNCARDYTNPLSRFYHAQPISCNNCAIPLKLLDSKNVVIAYGSKAIESCANILQQGEIICMKGLGGFALICNASNKESIMRLRKHKMRPKKPFVVMFSSLAKASKAVYLNAKEQEALTASNAPIVLASMRQNNPSSLALEEIAPNLTTLGVMLANTPLQHLLLAQLPFPIIYTSANRQKEPIITNITQAMEVFGGMISYFLDFSREIYNGIDDSIVRYIDNEIRPIRLARAYTPKSISLRHLSTPLLQAQDVIPESKKSIMALGAQDKANIVFAQGEHCLITPYVGNMESLAAYTRYQDNLAFFEKIYAFTPEIIISDKHPRYHTTEFAHRLCAKYTQDSPSNTTIQHLQIYHHHAHLCAILAECAHTKEEQILGIIWDGSGFGADKSIWGGEFLWGGFEGFDRVGYFEPFGLFGGEQAIKDIRRIGYMLALYAQHLPTIARLEDKLPKALCKAMRKALETLQTRTPKSLDSAPNTHTASMFMPMTSSVGRLIDGVAFLLGVLTHTSYEGEAGALLESLILGHKPYELSPYPYELHSVYNDKYIIIWNKLVYAICEDIHNQENKAKIASKFFYTLARIALQVALQFQQEYCAKNGYSLKVGFSGGVFQNKVLCEMIGQVFREAGITYAFHTIVPCNDGGIAFGQAAYGMFVGSNISKP